MSGISDHQIKQLNLQNEEEEGDHEHQILEGTLIPKATTLSTSNNPEKDLRARINSGEWDNLDDLPAFQSRTQEGQLLARVEAIDNRINQLQTHLPMLLNQYLHDAYIQVLKKIHTLRKTKTGLFYFSYKHQGQRDLSGE